jgi:hypothetical protein
MAELRPLIRVCPLAADQWSPNVDPLATIVPRRPWALGKVAGEGTCAMTLTGLTEFLMARIAEKRRRPPAHASRGASRFAPDWFVSDGCVGCCYNSDEERITEPIDELPHPAGAHAALLWLPGPPRRVWNR